jgi:hypothetical protein
MCSLEKGACIFESKISQIPSIFPCWPGNLGGEQLAPDWVLLDKSEGGVKDKNILSVFSAPLFCQRGLRTKTLEISR